MIYTNPGSLTQVLALDAGILLTVVNAQAASGSGVAQSQWFTVSERATDSERVMTLLGVPNGTTTLTVDVEVSPDAGVTWLKKNVGVALIAASVSTEQIISNMQPGYIYRINPTTNTGGTSASVLATAA